MKRHTFFYVAVGIIAATIYPLYTMDVVPYHGNLLKNKLRNKKNFSLEDWKIYQDSLMDLRQTSLNGQDRKRLKQLIHDTKEKIIIKETQLELKNIAARIRETKSTHIEDLREYRKTLKKYTKLLPESYPKKKSYDKTLYLVINRIGILRQIDNYLVVDYDTLGIESLEYFAHYLPVLQKKLNTPDSERHTLLDKKIEIVGEFIKEYDACYL